MDRNESRKAAEVMLAYADGKEIEWSYKDGNGCWLRWVKVDSPEFDWIDNDYRIKPQPKYRPFKDMEECWQEMQKHRPFGWIKDKRDGHYVQITTVADGEDNCALGPHTGWSLEGFFRNFTFADGEPFGVKEEE